MNAASEAAEVVQGLQQTTQGIAGASDKAVQGIETARRAEQQALQVGYNRVADGLVDIRKHIERVYQVLAAASREGGDAIDIASRVTKEVTPDDAAKLLRDTVTKIEAAVAQLQRASHDTRNLERDIVMVLRGAKPEPLLDCMDGITAGVRQAGKTALAAKKMAEGAIEGGGEISGN
jgi:hypothetical protein